MPISQDDISVKVSVETGEGRNALKDVGDDIDELGVKGKKTDASLEGLAEQIKANAVAALGLEAAISLAGKAFEFIQVAVEKVIEPIEKSIHAYGAYAGQVVKLSNALKVQGTYSEEAIGHYKELAEKLERTTVLSEEQVLSMAALGKAVRVPNETLEKMIKNSAGLAYVMGGSAEEAFQAQLASLTGNARALARYDVRLKDLDPSLARTGKGIELLGQKFGAFADVQAQSYGGTLIQIKNLTEKVFKEVGEAFFKAFDLKGQALIKKEFLEEVLHFVASVKPKLLEMAQSVADMKEKFNAALSEINWKDMIASVERLGVVFAAMIVALNVEAFASMLLKMSVSMSAFVLSGVKVLVVAAAFIALAGAVDIIARNFDHLNDVFDVIGNAFISLALMVDRGIKGMALALSAAFEAVLEPIAGSFLDVGNVASAALEKLRKDSRETADDMDELNGMIKASNKEVAEGSKKVDFGFLGQGAKFFEKLMSDANATIKDTGKEVGNIGGSMETVVAASKEYLDALKAIRNENFALAQKLAEFGLDEADRLKVALAFDLARIEAKKKDYAEQFKHDASKIAGLNAELNVQKALTEAVARRAILESRLGAQSPEAAAVGRVAGAAMQTVSDLMVMAGEEMGGRIGLAFEGYTQDAVDEFTVGVAKAFDYAVDVLGPVFDAAVGIFNPDVINGLTDGLKTVSDLPRNLLKAFNNLGTMVDRVIKTLPDAVAKLADALPGIIGKIADKIPMLIEKLAEALDKLINKLPAIFAKILDAMPQIIASVMQVLPGLIKSIFNALGDIVAQMIEALPGILNELLQGLPDIIEALIEGLISGSGKIVAGIINMLASGGVERIVGALLRAIPRIAVALVNGIVVGLKNAVGSIFGGIKIPDIGGELAANLGDAAKKVVDSATNVSDAVFKVIDINAAARADKLAVDISTAIDSSTDRMRSILEAILAKLKALWDGVRRIFEVIVGAIGQVWETIRTMVLEPFIAGLTFLWTSVVKPIFDGFLSIFQAVLTAAGQIFSEAVAGLKAVFGFLKQVWDAELSVLTSIIGAFAEMWSATFGVLRDIVGAIGSVFANEFEIAKGVFEGIVQSLSGLWDGIRIIFDGYTEFLKGVVAVLQGIFGTMKTVVTEAFDGVKKFFSELLKGHVDAAFKSLLDTFKTMGQTIWDGLKAAIDGALSVITGMGKSIFKGLSAGLDGYVTGLTNAGAAIWTGLKNGLQGLGDFITNQLNKVNPLNIFRKMFDSGDAWGTGTVEDTLGIDVPFISFAKGGIVPGSAPIAGDSPLNDSIMAMLSPGEVVVPRSVLDQPGMRAFIEGVAGGKTKLPSFYFGEEYVDKASGGVGSVAGDLGTAFGGLADAGKAGFKNLGELSEEKLNILWNFLQGLDPSKLWDKVLDKVGDGVMNMFEAHRFYEGGTVGGSSYSSPAPTMTFGQPTQRPTQVSNYYTISVAVDGSKPVDERALAKSIMDNIMSESTRGRPIIDDRGIVRRR